ncbi:MAG TPA: GH25 family lysozyme [Tepidisphaeraceae bacterium]|nr:GH25 family lysozyme [Tepidisphaeraceae bacterium]
MSNRPLHQVELLEPRQMMARALGIDVSDFQGTITVAQWQSIKASGKDFVFAKATEGLTFNASTFTNNITRAHTAGMLIGAYHFGRPDNNAAVAEADKFVSVISPYLTAGYVRPVLDIEVDAGSVAFMSQWVNDFCSRVRDVTGIAPLIYTGQFFASSNFNSTVTQWPLWIARYPGGTVNPETQNPGSTTPWPTWNIWQYTDSGSVPGITGNVDLNVYNGDLASFTNVFVIKPPLATVLQGATAIADGQTSAIDFGTVTPGGATSSITFTVRNDGQQRLNLGTVTVPAGYTITEGLSTSLLAGASDTFTVRLDSAVAGVKAGSISFSTNDPTANPFDFAVTGIVGTPDTLPPAVVQSAFLFDTAPHRVIFQFSENVGASLAAIDFEIRSVATNQTFPLTMSYNPGSFTATLSVGGTLADGNYTATVFAAGVTDAAGNVLPADVEQAFFHFTGDADHDRVVNLNDFTALAAGFGTGTTFSQGDFNYSGSVNLTDFTILASRFGDTLPPPAPPRPAGAKIVPFSISRISDDILG